MTTTVIKAFGSGSLAKGSYKNQHRQTLSAPKKVKGKERRSSKVLKRKINVNVSLGCGKHKED